MFSVTSILVRIGKNKAVIDYDGQVTFGNIILKDNITEVRILNKEKILAISTTRAFKRHNIDTEKELFVKNYLSHQFRKNFNRYKLYL